MAELCFGTYPDPDFCTFPSLKNREFLEGKTFGQRTALAEV